MTNGYRK